MISKIVGDLSSRFPDYAISPRTREEKKEKKDQEGEEEEEEEWIRNGAPVALSKRNAVHPGFCSPIHVHVHVYIYIYIWLDTWRAYDHENGLL